MRILIGMDPSPASSYIVDEAVSRPWPAESEFCVVHVVDEHQFGPFPKLVTDAKRQGERLINTASDRLSQAGQKSQAKIILGNPRKRISALAKRWKADLVMVGAHGQGVIARFLLGSVAQDTLRFAPCSVEIVRPSPSGKPASSHAMKILLATDGSEFSSAAAKSIAQQPWPSGSQIRILSVAELPVFPYPADGSSLSPVYPAGLLQELVDSARKRASEAVEAAREILVAAGLELFENQPNPLGDARALILEVAKEWQADLIVLGSHGRRGLDRLIMGSVSESVAIYAHCSVEIVRS
ncbi:MAG TPA: universal stress protein [Candidatus Acidoferrum sp.]|nr:universal stress protein [Candidatus Acidoferrum sp.]